MNRIDKVLLWKWSWQKGGFMYSLEEVKVVDPEIAQAIVDEQEADL